MRNSFSSVRELHNKFPDPQAVELENLALRHQLRVLRRQRPGRLRLFTSDRLLWVLLYRLWPRCLDVILLVKPATVVQWHRRGFRLFWRWRTRPGRPAVDREIRDLIRQMRQRQSALGCASNPRRTAQARHRGQPGVNAGLAKLIARGSFSSSDVFLLAVAEHADMLIAHEVGASNTNDDESRRAESGTSLRLAASRLGRILLEIIERCWFVHANNIATFWADFRITNLFCALEREPKRPTAQHSIRSLASTRRNTTIKDNRTLLLPRGRADGTLGLHLAVKSMRALLFDSTV